MITDRPRNGTTDPKPANRMGSTSSPSTDAASRLGELGDLAQEKLGEAASYVRDRGVSGLQTDLSAAVSRNPLGAIAVGVGLGYVLGRILRRG